MKNWFVYMIMMLFFASCSEQQIMEEMASLTKLTEQKSMTVSPKDSIMSLLYQARWGDGSAYLKLADCYRDGIGVKKDFFGMITMAHMAEGRKVEEAVAFLFGSSRTAARCNGNISAAYIDISLFLVGAV